MSSSQSFIDGAYAVARWRFESLGRSTELPLRVAARLPLPPPLAADKLSPLSVGDSCVVTRLPALALVGLSFIGFPGSLASLEVFRPLQDVQAHLELLSESCIEHPATLAPLRVISVVEHDPTGDRVVVRIDTFHALKPLLRSFLPRDAVRNPPRLLATRARPVTFG